MIRQNFKSAMEHWKYFYDYNQTFTKSFVFWGFFVKQFAYLLG